MADVVKLRLGGYTLVVGFDSKATTGHATGGPDNASVEKVDAEFCKILETLEGVALVKTAAAAPGAEDRRRACDALVQLLRIPPG